MNEKIRHVCHRREFVRNTVLGTGALVMSGALINTSGAFGQEAKTAAGKTTIPDLGPLVLIPDVKIRMRQANAFLVGVSPSEEIEISLRDVIKIHGFCAGGSTLVFRQAQEALKVLFGDELPVRQGIKVETAYHCCQAGAVAYITGTVMSAINRLGDLVLLPEETRKVVFTDKRNGKNVTVQPLVDPHAIFSPLFKQMIQDNSTAPQVRKLLNETVQDYINSPWQKLFTLTLG